MRSTPDQSVTGNEDRWVLFNREFSDGSPIVVVGRAGNSLINERLATSHLTIVDCIAEDDLVNDWGMPQHTDRLYAIEDKLSEKLEALPGQAFHIASVTGNGARRIFFLHDEPVDFSTIISGLAAEGYRFASSAAAYSEKLHNLIVPNAVDCQLDADRQVIASLSENGDDVDTPRKTDFWFFGNSTSLKGLAADLEPWGFNIDRWMTEESGAVLTCQTSVNLTSFQQLTPVLVAAAEKRQVVYDGWETVVVGSDGIVSESEQFQKPTSMFTKLFGAKKN
ncbi:DUF695 domain-containing protein [Qipengyuania atrilutea]|uniref:DUF695 domain-containing protein n=1 Tax=Qipengyuania atrilutea TaxID=2744473 RepID=A0A850GZT2_9SPHN|nr:DUF695 domain-containing protein [Actirhodobacter atriluteus]NVD43740.1 DUF695 domain-containing protein [Actirhodobacter atriluteus]